jgi:hypothetical protein
MDCKDGLVLKSRPGADPGGGGGGTPGACPPKIGKNDFLA